MNRHVPAGAGLAGIGLCALVADVWAVKTNRPTISAAIATSLDHPVGGVLVVGGLAGLGWHLVADPIVRRLAVRVAEEV